MEKNTMVNTFIPVASAIGGTVTYVVLGLLADEGVIPHLSFLGEISGGLTVGGLLFFILRWALKRNDSLTDKLHQMHEERNRIAEERYNKLESKLDEIILKK